MRTLIFILDIILLPLRPFFWVLCRLGAKPCPKCGEKWMTTLTGEWDGEDWMCGVCEHHWNIDRAGAIRQ